MIKELEEGDHRKEKVGLASECSTEVLVVLVEKIAAKGSSPFPRNRLHPEVA